MLFSRSSYRSLRRSLHWLGARILYSALLVGLFVALGANKSCNEDYFFATQLSLRNPTPEVTGTPTEIPDDTEIPDEEDETPTATPRGTRTPLIEPSPTGTAEAVVAGEMFPLSALQEIPPENAAKEVAAPTATVAPQSGVVPNGKVSRGPRENWLGNIYNKSEEPEASAVSRVLVVSEDPAFQRSVAAALSGIATHVTAVTDEIELEDFFDSSVAMTVLDASSSELSPCEAVDEIRHQQRVEGSASNYTAFVVVQGTGSEGSSSGSTYACQGSAVGEVLARPLNRAAIARAFERAAQKGVRSSR